MNRRYALGVIASVLANPYAFAEAALDRYSDQERSELLTTQIYDRHYNSYQGKDAEVADRLYSLSLHDSLDRKIITPGVRDFYLPLGVSNNGKIDFVKGMRDMWNDKKGINKSRELQKRRDYFVSLVKKRTISSLREYRANEVSRSISMFKELHSTRRKKRSGDYRDFMDIISDSITPNVLLGYAIHEMTPPVYNGRKINPAFKAWFVDRLFKEAGKEFIEGYPARYDRLMSYGPFQMTDISMPDVSAMNKYLSGSERVPYRVKDFRGLQDHTNAAAVLASVRWEQLGNHLKKRGLLRKFMRAFDDLDEKERQIVVAGITACMHHLPYPTMERVGWYVEKGDPEKMHYDIRESSMPKQLKKYYDSASEAYLFMKVFHVLEEKNKKV